MLRTLRRAVPILLLAIAGACGDEAAGPLAPGLPSPPGRAGEHADRVLFLEAARGAWGYVARETEPATGLVHSIAGYPYATAWDIGSAIGAIYSAGELGLIAPGDYQARMGRLLGTLETAPLFDGVALSRVYSTRTGAITEFNGPHDGPPQRGSGWSATDVGRLLVWLRVIAENDPVHAPLARRVAERMDLARMVEGGYLQGAEAAGEGVRLYQEGRVGYEQYAAYGFALWGHRADRALRLGENTLPITVFDIPLVADRRGDDHLTSEPFLMAGLEVGWSREMRDLATRMLRVQAERYHRTGQVTILSEDALNVPPHYFYYYAFNFHGTPFAVVAPGTEAALDGPRWVSAKAAFGWHALLPDAYTRLAVFAVSPAMEPGVGWGAGIYEATGQRTGWPSLNTAALILEAALYAQTGRPLLYGG